MSVSESKRGSAGGRPTLLLDVDGVINAMPARRKPRGYSRYMIDAYQIHIHDDIPDMVDRLREHFDIAWFTMWNDLAAPLIGPHVGLEDAPFVETSWERGWDTMNALGYSRRQINKVFYAKTPLLPDSLAREQRWVWVDDAHGRWDREYLERQGFDPQNFRLVGTDSAAGLTWPDVQRAIDFTRDAPGSADTTPRPGDPRASPTDESVATRSHHPGSAPGRTSAVTPTGRDRVKLNDTEAQASGRSADGVGIVSESSATCSGGESVGKATSETPGRGLIGRYFRRVFGQGDGSA